MNLSSALLSIIRLGISAKLSDILQKESPDLGSATSLILATTDTLKSLRCDDQWDLLWQEVIAFANHHQIEMIPHSNSRWQRHPPTTISDHILTAETIISDNSPDPVSSDGYKHNIYYPTIDIFICEMGKLSFDEINRFS